MNLQKSIQGGKSVCSKKDKFVFKIRNNYVFLVDMKCL